MLARLGAVFVIAGVGAGCEAGTRMTEAPPTERPDTMPPVLDVSRPCDRSYYAGDSGCARIVVLLEAPPGPLPPLYRMSVRTWFPPERELADHMQTVGQNPPLHPGLMTIMRRNEYPLPTTDTASVLVTAYLFEDVRPVRVGVPLPVFAADSVLITAKFAPVGSVPRVDTVQLVLKRP